MILVLLIVLSVLLVPNGECSLEHKNRKTPDFYEFIQNFKETSKNSESISSACLEQFILYSENLAAFDDDLWGLRNRTTHTEKGLANYQLPHYIPVFDATGKLPSGILSLNLAILGDFDECLSIEASESDVKGKYCLASLGLDSLDNTSTSYEPSKTLYSHFNKSMYGVEVDNNEDSSIEYQIAILPSWGVCIPHKCSRDDFKEILKMFSIPSYAVNCQTKEDLQQPLDTGAIVTICYFGFFVILMITATIYDLLRNQSSPPYRLLLGFSVYTNGKRLLRTSENPEQLACLDGIRFLSMLWVIIGHNAFKMIYGPLANILDAANYFSTTRSLIFSNAVYSVDTFFVVSGFLVVYGFMKSYSQGRKFNIFMFYMHRYLRLVFPLIPAVLASMYLIKYIGSGPFHPQMIQYTEPCKKHWLSRFTFVSNYVNTLESCVPQTWYLDVDMQLYFLSPLFLLFLPKRPMIGLGLLLTASIGVLTTNFVITWNNKLVPTLTITNIGISDYLKKIYLKTHTRASTWLVGAFLGYILGKMKFQYGITSLKLSKWLVLMIWGTVLTLLPVCIFGGKDVILGSEYNGLAAASYSSFGKLAWGTSISLLIFACFTGNGGVINQFLSLSMFQVLNRLTYSIYLVHLTTMYIIAVCLKQPAYFSLFDLTYSFWSIFDWSFGISIIWVLAFESPVPTIEKFILNILRFETDKKLPISNGISNGITSHIKPIERDIV